MGGIIDVIVGAGLVYEAPDMNALVGQTSLGVSATTLLTVYGAFGVAFGVVSVASALMLYLQPVRHRLWGALVTVFALLGWFGSIGGGVIGSILGLVGGISGMKWTGAATPSAAAYASPSYLPMPPQIITRICPTCGRVLTNEMRFCPYCGRNLSAAPDPGTRSA